MYVISTEKNLIFFRLVITLLLHTVKLKKNIKGFVSETKEIG
jgi:hypothetical protein